MGMVLGYIRVSPRNAAALLENPERLRSFLDPTPPRSATEAPSPSGLGSRWWGTSGGHRPHTAAPFESRDPKDHGTADKSWNAIHYLLTGSAHEGTFPAGFILVGGTPVGDVDVGYGPARLFTPGEVREIEGALSKINREVAQRRFDGAAMDAAGVYPQIWARTDEEVFEYAWENLRALQEFVRHTVERNQALILLLT